MIRRVATLLVALATLLAAGAVVASPASANPPTWAVNIRPDGTGKCMDVTGVSYDNGAPIQLYDCLGGTQYNQVFYLVQNPSNAWEVRIVASHSGKCLDVQGVSQSPGAILQQYDCLGWNQRNQVFYMYPLYPGNRWYIQPTHSYQYVTYQGLFNGASVFQWPTGGGPVWLIA